MKTKFYLQIERFIQQIIASEAVALTGMKYFHLTRKLLFGVKSINVLYILLEKIIKYHYTIEQMAGTIVTYELVLLQFDTSHLEALVVKEVVCELIQ